MVIVLKNLACTLADSKGENVLSLRRRRVPKCVKSKKSKEERECISYWPPALVTTLAADY